MKLFTRIYEDAFHSGYTHKDIGWLKNGLLFQYQLAEKILQSETPVWGNKKNVTFVHPSPSELYRTSHNFPVFEHTDSDDCVFTTPIVIDLCIKDKPGKKPYVLNLYRPTSRFKPYFKKDFETEEKMLAYFEKLKGEIEVDYAEATKDLDKKIAFIQKELARCTELRKQVMARRGS